MCPRAHSGGGQKAKLGTFGTFKYKNIVLLWSVIVLALCLLSRESQVRSPHDPPILHLTKPRKASKALRGFTFSGCSVPDFLPARLERNVDLPESNGRHRQSWLFRSPAKSATTGDIPAQSPVPRRPKFIAIDIEMSDCFKECLCGNGRMFAVPPIFSLGKLAPARGGPGSP